MDAVVDVLVQYGYVVVFGWVFAEQIGLPLPAVPVLLAAGAVAGNGRLSVALVLVLAAVASLVSDTIWYWIGRVRGGRVLGWLCRISLEPDSCVRRTQRLFSARGARSLLIAKFVPGFSTAAPPLAGIVRMPVDLRDSIDFETEPSIIPGALHMTTEELEARHHEIPREREIVLYCT